MFIYYITFAVFSGFRCWMFWISSKKLCYVRIFWCIYVLAISYNTWLQQGLKSSRKEDLWKKIYNKQKFSQKELNPMYVFHNNCISRQM